MAPKRKATSNAVSNKKQKIKATVEDYKQFYASTLKLVNNLKDENNERQLVSPFIKLPSKKMYPDYYTIITDPITVSDIQKKLSKGKYTETLIDEFVADFQLLHDNAKAYNDPESWIVQDAKRLLEFVEEQVRQFEENGPSEYSTKAPKLKIKKPSKPSDDKGDESKSAEISNDNLPELCINLLKEVMDHEFPEIGIISEPFIEDIDPKDYPEYFQIIKKPTSFNKIIRLIEKKKLFSAKATVLENLQTFHDMTVLIFSNAQLFNDPSSLIHQDSIKLNEFFEEKYEDLKASIEGQSQKENKLKLKLKNPVKNEPSKVKLNLKFKTGKDSGDQKKSRKKKDIESPVPMAAEPEDELEDEFDDDINETKNNDDQEMVEDVVQSQENIDEEDDDDDMHDSDREFDAKLSNRITTAPANILGKSFPSLSLEETIIQNISIVPSQSLVNLLLQKLQQANLVISKTQKVAASLFPTIPYTCANSIYEYKFPPNGYASQSYSLNLPPGSPPFISLKVSLHNLLYQIKKSDLSNGQGYANLSSDDEFQCQLYVNSDEVSNVGDIQEDKVSNDKGLLSIQYDLKLSYGVNILDFECKIAPNLSKKIRKSVVKEEMEDIGGRHTRHQLQQLKMNWDVEKFSFIILCNNL